MRNKGTSKRPFKNKDEKGRQLAILRRERRRSLGSSDRATRKEASVPPL
jgi:hypothetical protein